MCWSQHGRYVKSRLRLHFSNSFCSPELHENIQLNHRIVAVSLSGRTCLPTLDKTHSATFCIIARFLWEITAWNGTIYTNIKVIAFQLQAFRLFAQIIIAMMANWNHLQHSAPKSCLREKSATERYVNVNKISLMNTNCCMETLNCYAAVFKAQASESMNKKFVFCFSFRLMLYKRFKFSSGEKKSPSAKASPRALYNYYRFMFSSICIIVAWYFSSSASHSQLDMISSDTRRCGEMRCRLPWLCESRVYSACRCFRNYFVKRHDLTLAHTVIHGALCLM